MNPVYVQEAAGAFETTMFVHAPQLLFSSDSVITPAEFLSVLSAQTRSEYEPFDGNVYDLLKVPVPPAARVAILTEAVSVIVPPPLGPVATCMKLLNDAPVLAEPILLIVVLNDVGTSFVAVVGEMEPAVRSGATVVT